MYIKIVKIVTIEAQFPELKGPSCYQRGRGSASTVRVAGMRAMENLLSSQALKRKRVSRFSATVSIGEVRTEVGATKEAQGE